MELPLCLNRSKIKVIFMHHLAQHLEIAFLPKQRICVFCTDLRTNSDNFPIQN